MSEQFSGRTTKKNLPFSNKAVSMLYFNFTKTLTINTWDMRLSQFNRAIFVFVFTPYDRRYQILYKQKSNL